MSCYIFLYTTILLFGSICIFLFLFHLNNIYDMPKCFNPLKGSKHVSFGNWDNLKWVGHVSNKKSCAKNLNVWPNVILNIFYYVHLFLHLYKINIVKHCIMVLVLNKHYLYMICLVLQFEINWKHKWNQYRFVA